MTALAALTATLSALLVADGPAGAGKRCTASAHQGWADRCLAAIEAELAPTRPAPSDPWQILEEFRFTAPDLDAAFAGRCAVLANEPSRLPADRRSALARRGWPATADPCTAAEHRAWLRTCVADATRLGAGDARRAILAAFQPDGGISTFTQQAFVHRRCALVRVEVTFAASAGGRQDDRILAVRPAIGRPHTD